MKREANGGLVPGSRSGAIAYAAWRWEGVYESRDVPGGVEVTSVRGAIHTVSSDGGVGPVEIVPSGERTAAPAFSPDGRRLYYQQGPPNASRIWSLPADGSGVPHRVAPAEGSPWASAFGFALSPDGRQIVCTVTDGRRTRLLLVAADGADPEVLAPEFGDIYMPAFGPGGDVIAFSGPATGYRLGLLRAGNSTPRIVTPDHPQSFVPRFTPDGDALVFVRRDGDLYRADLATGAVHRLTTGSGYHELRLSPLDRHGSTDGPDVSPDGRRIAYIAVRDGVPSVCTISLDGTGFDQVTFVKAPSARVRWSPDSRRLAFVSFVSGLPQLFVVDARGGEPVQLTEGNSAVTSICWKG